MSNLGKLKSVFGLSSTPDTLRRQEFRIAAQDHFLSGMRGAFFFALLINLAVDVARVADRADWDRIVRYAYLMWFMAYFFMAAVNNKLANQPPANLKDRHESVSKEWPQWRDIWYDVVQALAAWLAVFALGFVTPMTARPSFCNSALCSSHAIALYAIIVILAGAWLLYHKTSKSGNVTRIGGIGVAVVALLLIECQFHVTATMAIAAICLWCLLIRHFIIRLDKGYYRSPD